MRRFIVRFEFHDLENIDGYFSGVIYINTDKERYILEFGYDIEFKKLKLLNSTNIMYNSNCVSYDYEKLAEIKEDYGAWIIREIEYRLNG